MIFAAFVVFFFFSSRRRHTRCYRDWSSDVCSSDLGRPGGRGRIPARRDRPGRRGKPARCGARDRGRDPQAARAGTGRWAGPPAPGRGGRRGVRGRAGRHPRGLALGPGVASDTPRRLVLLRHAKSDWPDVADEKRPLAKRGRRDAPVIGRWLRDHGYVPDVVVCSVARRARQTWELVAPELGGSPSVTFEPRAYDASATTLLHLARELPSAARAALLIGHN